MTHIKKIRISGFRGILAPLELDFAKGGACQSMILYGANGTGKSSITDAWEWVMAGKVQHLAREGAEENAYPHMAADGTNTYVEIQFSDADVGTVGLEFDRKRVTMPMERGYLSEARKRVSHSCHIRYADLTRFVLQRKAERYDALASFMGFVPQIEYQKSLRRVQNQLDADMKRLAAVIEDVHARFEQHFASSIVDRANAISQLVQRCEQHGISSDPTPEALVQADVQFKEFLRADPQAGKLANLQSLETAINACLIVADIGPQLDAVIEAVGQLRAEQVEQTNANLLLPLFQTASDFLAKVEPTGCCPLCGQFFSGDLRDHVRGELDRMKHLQQVHQRLNDARTALVRTVSAQKGLLATYDCGIDPDSLDLSKAATKAFRTSVLTVDNAFARLRESMAFDATHLQDGVVLDLKAQHESLIDAMADFEQARKELLAEVAMLFALPAGERPVRHRTRRAEQGPRQVRGQRR